MSWAQHARMCEASVGRPRDARQLWSHQPSDLWQPYTSVLNSDTRLGLNWITRVRKLSESVAGLMHANTLKHNLPAFTMQTARWLTIHSQMSVWAGICDFALTRSPSLQSSVLPQDNVLTHAALT